jgi:hypothetical protein
MGINSITIEGQGTTYFDLLTGFNSVSINLPVSLGRIEYPEGTLLEENGVVQITNDETGEFYSVPIINGLFYFYIYTDENNINVQTTLSANVLTYKGSLTILAGEASSPPIYTLLMKLALTMATKRLVSTLNPLPILFENDFDLGECCYNELVFAKPFGQWWENDKSSFLLKRFIETDSIIFKLYKDDEFLVNLVNNTYGEFHNFQMYVGYIIYWENIYTIFGRGSYKIKADMTVAGQSMNWQSRDFCLEQYDTLRADKTFRLETYQTGSILRSGYNYDELGLNRGWYQSYRVRGKFGNKKPTLESDYLLTSDRRLLQLQDKVSYEYELQTDLIPADLANSIIEDNLIANEIFISDYNIFNSEVYRRIELIPSSISDVKHYSNNRRISYTITFKDRFDNILKRN